MIQQELLAMNCSLTFLLSRAWHFGETTPVPRPNTPSTEGMHRSDRRSRAIQVIFYKPATWRQTHERWLAMRSTCTALGIWTGPMPLSAD